MGAVIVAVMGVCSYHILRGFLIIFIFIDYY